MRVSSGGAQDPLNYLQRRVTQNQRYSKTLKRHLTLAIRKAKGDVMRRPHTFEELQVVSSRISSYGRRLYLEETLDSLDATDKRYKDLILGLVRMSDDAKKNLVAVRDTKNRAQDRRPVPTSRTTSHAHEPQDNGAAA